MCSKPLNLVMTVVDPLFSQCHQSGELSFSYWTQFLSSSFKLDIPYFATWHRDLKRFAVPIEMR